MQTWIKECFGSLDLHSKGNTLYFFSPALEIVSLKEIVGPRVSAAEVKANVKYSAEQKDIQWENMPALRMKGNVKGSQNERNMLLHLQYDSI